MVDELSVNELIKQVVSSSLELHPKQAKRLLHGRGGCFSGWQHLNMDYYAGVLLLTWFSEPKPDEEVALLGALLVAFKQHCDGLLIGVCSQHRYQKPATMAVLWGDVPAKLIVNEGKLAFWVDMQRQNSGLFMDMAPGRQWLLNHTQGCHVLNTFAFTCSLSVAAIAGGAKRVINIDMNGGVLKRGRENQHLNEQQLANVEYLPHKVLSSIGKLARKGPFDLVIADPPTFQRGSFEFDKDYARLLRSMPRLLAKQATLLLCCNSPRVSQQAFQDMIAQNLPQATFVERLQNNPDFVEQGEAPLKGLVYHYQAERPLIN